MKQFGKISYNVDKLNPTESFIYSILVLKQKDQISREYLKECLHSKDEKHISDIITSIENKGLIKREKKYTQSKSGVKRWLSYTLLYDARGGFKLGYDYYESDLDVKTKGFSLLLRTVALTSSLSIEYNKKELAKRLGVSRPTLDKHLKIMMAKGVIDSELNFVSFFQNTTKNYLSKCNQETLVKLIKSCKYQINDDKIKITDLSETEYPKKDVLRAAYYYNKKLYSLPNADNIFNKMIGGMGKGR